MEILSDNDCDKLQEDLDAVVHWCESNSFKLNIKKCVCMSFTLNNNAIRKDYTIGDTTLERVPVTRDLGVLYDDSLNFADHITLKILESYKTMGFIIRNSKQFSIEVCLRLFDSLVLTKLEYSRIVWSPQYDVWIGVLEAIHRKFLKYMFLKKFGFYPERGFDHQTLLNIFKRMSLESRRIKMCLIYIFKLINHNVDCPEILALLPFYVKRINSRNNDTFYLDFPRLNLYKNSPIYRMCDLFNRFMSDVNVSTLSLKNYIKILDSKLKTQASPYDMSNLFLLC